MKRNNYLAGILIFAVILFAGSCSGSSTDSDGTIIGTRDANTWEGGGGGGGDDTNMGGDTNIGADDTGVLPDTSGGEVGDNDSGTTPTDSGETITDSGEGNDSGGGSDSGVLSDVGYDAGDTSGTSEKDILCDQLCQRVKPCTEIYVSVYACLSDCMANNTNPPSQELRDNVTCVTAARDCDEAKDCLGIVEDTGVVDTGVQDTGVQDTGVEDTGVKDTGPRDTGPAPDAGEPVCDHSPTDCSYKPNCASDDNCPCSFTCVSGKCLSQHCYCSEQRGESPCGTGMECDQNGGFCVKVSAPCKADSECQVRGPSWHCDNGKCARDDAGCKTDADCADYAPAVYKCTSGMCQGAAVHGESCPNHKDWDCASGHYCISGICHAACSDVGQPCPPPASGTCYQSVIPIYNIPDGPAYCK